MEKTNDQTKSRHTMLTKKALHGPQRQKPQLPQQPKKEGQQQPWICEAAEPLVEEAPAVEDAHLPKTQQPKKAE
jgi:hypothetical protein